MGGWVVGGLCNPTVGWLGVGGGAGWRRAIAVAGVSGVVAGFSG